MIILVDLANKIFWEKLLNGKFLELVLSVKTDEAKSFLYKQIDDFDEDIANQGEVYLVGAGPGDPDLLTFKALRLMQQADVALYAPEDPIITFKPRVKDLPELPPITILGESDELAYLPAHLPIKIPLPTPPPN